MHVDLYVLVFEILFWLGHVLFEAVRADWRTCFLVLQVAYAWRTKLRLDLNLFLVIFYFFFWVVRINGCFRRGLQPLLRGREWFFNVHVQPDFYTGAGRPPLQWTFPWRSLFFSLAASCF